MLFRRFILTLGLFTVSALTGLSAGELKLSSHISNHMVLQHGKASTIRGVAAAGAEVKAVFSPAKGSGQAEQTKTAKASDTGSWELQLDPLKASAKGATLTITSGKDKISLTDILVGDVFVIARQTSIDISLGRDSAGKKTAASHKANPLFRALVIHTRHATESL